MSIRKSLFLLQAMGTANIIVTSLKICNFIGMLQAIKLKPLNVFKLKVI